MNLIENLIASGVILTTPILLAAIGGLVNREGGIVNIGLEAKMLAGALLALIVSGWTGSWLLGIIAAALTGGLIGLLFSFTVTRLHANMIVAGLGLNVLTAGIIGFVLKWTLGASRTFRMPGVALLPRIEIPLIERAPVLGSLVSGLDPLTWLAWICAALLPFFLYRTRMGLRLRAVGAAEEVSRSVGLSTAWLKDWSTVAAGVFSGLAGAHLSLGMVGLFNSGITAGRGFIALAAFYFGRNRPWPTALVCLLYGLLDAGQIRLQTFGLPPNLIQTIPYLMVVVALCVSGWRLTRLERSVP